MKCARCGATLTAKMEIEYSGYLGEYYCSPDCATDRYFEHMESEPVRFGHWRSQTVRNGDGSSPTCKRKRPGLW